MVLVQLLHVPQAALAAYGLYLSYISISNLKQYEEKSEKAAKWSNEAERQLHKTRTTQATGALNLLASFIISALLITRPNLLPSIARYSLSPAMLIGMLFARSHVSNFWSNKAKVPFVEGYNEAISKTKEVMTVMEYLEYSWVATALLGAIIGY